MASSAWCYCSLGMGTEVVSGPDAKNANVLQTGRGHGRCWEPVVDAEQETTLN